MTRIILFIVLFFFLTVTHAVTKTTERVKFIALPEVQEFINYMNNRYNFDKKILVDLFSAVKVRPKIILSIKCPIERKPWYTYRTLYVTEKRIRNGAAFWTKYQDALERAEQLYGVPISIIVATIGIETKYGKDTGDYPVIDALSNLAFDHDNARRNYFRKELEEFLLLAREQHLNPAKVMGSYAGAIGQPQFMPSSFRHYAVNFSGNPHIDLNHNVVDVIGSIANYYHKNGWHPNESIALPVSMGGGRFQLSLTRPKGISLFELIENGMASVSHDKQKQSFKIIVLRGNYGNEYWYGFHNFEVIKRYNRSELYAMAVFQLSYYLAAAREKNDEKN